ncbi:unnamed protein product [Ectocarpus sp. CCAP 1310/34]|nr:unnamed protein product [Ectocarpus sp. CCAP 1310/34]
MMSDAVVAMANPRPAIRPSHPLRDCSSKKMLRMVDNMSRTLKVGSLNTISLTSLYSSEKPCTQMSLKRRSEMGSPILSSWVRSRCFWLK